MFISRVMFLCVQFNCLMYGAIVDCNNKGHDNDLILLDCIKYFL